MEFRLTEIDFPFTYISWREDHKFPQNEIFQYRSLYNALFSALIFLPMVTIFCPEILANSNNNQLEKLSKTEENKISSQLHKLNQQLIILENLLANKNVKPN